jgi:uncharacterized membrane protein
MEKNVMLFKTLLVIHVCSAIFGLGPGFGFIPIKLSAKTLTQLRFAYTINRALHGFVMTGGFLLLATGLTMGFLEPHFFHRGWYVTSLILYFIALSIGPLVLTPKIKPIRVLLAEAKGDDIPHAYVELHRPVLVFEWILNSLFTIIILLMLTKPF